uniref:Uncharacterized protein n=1 Tax=Tanacetum cinerariifolium TaxID=118510 RepID=A0A6L2KJ09_TANCI|nr:hypothetical protein [Tanacetum cinerariifolium]
MQQLMQNPEDISNATMVIDMTLGLMAKAFKLNNITPTNNNQRSSSNPLNMQIAQPSMNMDQEKQMLMVEYNVGNQFRPNVRQIAGNQNRYNAVQNVGNQLGHNGVLNSNIQKNENKSRNGNIAQKEEAWIQLNLEEFKFMATAGAYDKMGEVNANCTLKDNLQQPSTPGTQTYNAPVYNSDGSAEVHYYDNLWKLEGALNSLQPMGEVRIAKVDLRCVLGCDIDLDVCSCGEDSEQ